MFESPVVSVHIPPVLRQWTNGRAEITASGDTVGDVLQAVGREYPAVRPHLISDAGVLAGGIAVYLGARSIGELQGLDTAVDLEEVLSILPQGNG